MKNLFIFSFTLMALFVTGCTNSDSRNNQKATSQLREQNKLQKLKSASREEIDLYRLQVAYEIQKRWVFTGKVPDSKQFRTAIAFKVLPDGKITDICYVDKSNNDDLNESAYNAIKNASPVKPFPDNISYPYIEMGLRFAPEGIK